MLAKNIAAVKKCQAQVILVGFCTSRGTTCIKDFADIEILKATGVEVAMANAIPDVKAIATAHALSCDEDGIAEYMEKWILFEF